jgi:hypothetical protein
MVKPDPVQGERKQRQLTNHTFRKGGLPKAAISMDVVVARSGSRAGTSGSSVISRGFEPVLGTTDNLAGPVPGLTWIPVATTTVGGAVKTGLSTLTQLVPMALLAKRIVDVSSTSTN